MTVKEISWLPQWTTPVKIESGGRHPLGLNRFHNGMEDLLIKSITWLADSLPYLTFSCWAIGDIAKEVNPTNGADFVTAFQRRETALAIGRYLHQSTDYIPGSNKIAKVVSDDSPEYDTGFSVMESNSLGAYGLYYAGSAYNLGLVEYDLNGVAVLTSAGRRLYEILDRRYKKSASTYYSRYRGKARVPKQVLLEWGQINDFTIIRSPEGSDERQFYQRLLFRLDQPEAEDYRRATLAFFLECIDCCNATDTDFSENVLRNVDYYTAYTDHSGRARSFDVPHAFRDVQFYWNIYEGQVYFREWLTRYFQVFLNHLKVHSYGSNVEIFFDELDTEVFDTTLNRFLGRQNHWLDDRIGAILNAIGGPPNLNDTFSEESVTAAVDRNTSSYELVAMFTLVLVGVWHHFHKLRTDRRYQSIMVSFSNHLWFDVLYRVPDLANMSVRAFLRMILQQHVIAQHDRIMMEKQDLRRCWFTMENGRYFFVADDSLLSRPAKYGTIMAYLRDMNLIDTAENGIQLTAEGKTFYSRMKREFFS